MHPTRCRPTLLLCPECRVFQTAESSSRRARRASFLALVGFLGLSLLVWIANGAVTGISVHGWFLTLARPALAPPDWLFAPVWTLLYATIGVSAWLVWRRVDAASHRKRAALQLWGWQLLANALWPAAFFGLQNPGLGLAIIAVLVVIVGLTIRAFWPLQRMAALLLLPYFTWLIFASYLNIGFWWLNRV